MMNRKGYSTLAAAVFANTAKDLKAAMAEVEKHPDRQAGYDKLDEIAEFLESDWAQVLQGLSGGNELEKLKEVVYGY